MNENALRVIGYLVKSHVAWDYLNSGIFAGCDTEIIVDEFLMDMVIYL